MTAVCLTQMKLCAEHSVSACWCVQVKACLPWLIPGNANEYRRYAAVLLLRELADCAPAVFNVHVKQFIDNIWGGLRDPKLHVREASVQALQVRKGLTGFRWRVGSRLGSRSQSTCFAVFACLTQADVHAVVVSISPVIAWQAMSAYHVQSVALIA